MEGRITYQRMRKELANKFLLAQRYYSLVSVLNNLKLTEREIELTAYTAIKGNITYANIREEFCRTYKTSSPTINNMISRLKKLRVFIKENGKIKIAPILSLNFDNDVTLEIKLVHEQKTT